MRITLVAAEPIAIGLIAAGLLLASSPSFGQTPTGDDDFSYQLRHPYQASASNKSCLFQGDCSVVFRAILGRRVLILHASCDFFLASGGTVQNVVLSGANVGGGNPRNVLPAFSFAPQNTGTAWGVNASTHLFFNHGDQPRIDVVSGTVQVQSLDCTISGYGI
jgi:hypothetical protein